jgi:hypothetical protein
MRDELGSGRCSRGGIGSSYSASNGLHLLLAYFVLEILDSPFYAAIRKSPGIMVKVQLSYLGRGPAPVPLRISS